MYYNINGEKQMKRYKFAGMFPLAIAGLILGSNLGLAYAVNQLPTSRPDTQNVQSTLPVSNTPDGRLYTAYQLEGGNRQTVQLTASNANTPQPATVSIQGNQEDADTTQPALGYGALGWTLQ